MAQAPLSKKRRAMALSALQEGMAVNSICRTLGMGKHNFLNFMLETRKLVRIGTKSTFAT